MKFFILILSLFLLGSCKEESTFLYGKVLNIEYAHIGHGEYKQIITYEYSFKGDKYEGIETNYVDRNINYIEGDSIVVSISLESPAKSKLVGKNKPKNVKIEVIEFESR